MEKRSVGYLPNTLCTKGRIQILVEFFKNNWFGIFLIKKIVYESVSIPRIVLVWNYA